MRDRSKELDCMDIDSEPYECKVFLKGPYSDDELDQRFFDMVQQIRESLELLRSKVKALESSQMKVLCQPFPGDSMKKDLESLREEVKVLAKEIRGKLEKIEMKYDDDQVRGSVHKRMKKTQHGVLSKQFIEVINHCNLIQTRYRESNVNRIKRQLQITGQRLTDDQFDDMLESGQSDIFTCNVSKGSSLAELVGVGNEYLKSSVDVAVFGL
ncbi:PREDICTED: syntaxin-4-like [Nanorana parkeri]|uniref:syntaxin-4-like n=1 Tax=Nanorana parkeri TaxID=125878 RepID=UPI000853F0B4|nr:PREDICTED: syntaxin-4-like [Nanorana parkeri]